ncbi:MAG: flavin reductase family protein [Coriobacteriia bacterium]|nr:flavin reductase family protein [Coriobacteriia bacterium]
MKQSISVSGLIFPNPVMVVGTYDEHGEPNACTVAWGGIASSGPESVSIGVRPSRHTYDALHRTKAFTINLPSVEHAAAADYFGMVSGRHYRKFEVTKLTPVRGDYVDAPYIAEFPFCMECTITHTVDLGLHTLFIGQIRDVKIDESLKDEKGNLDLARAKILTFDSGQLAYRAPGEIIGEAFAIGRKFIAK